MNQVELKAIFHGKVQKVGFRWTVVERAEQFGLVGTVRNLPNGCVEACIVGEKHICEKFIESLQKNPGLAKFSKIEQSYSISKKTYTDFKII